MERNSIYTMSELTYTFKQMPRILWEPELFSLMTWMSVKYWWNGCCYYQTFGKEAIELYLKKTGKRWFPIPNMDLESILMFCFDDQYKEFFACFQTHPIQMFFQRCGYTCNWYRTISFSDAPNTLEHQGFWTGYYWDYIPHTNLDEDFYNLYLMVMIFPSEQDAQSLKIDDVEKTCFWREGHIWYKYKPFDNKFQKIDRPNYDPPKTRLMWNGSAVQIQSVCKISITFGRAPLNPKSHLYYFR